MKEVAFAGEIMTVIEHGKRSRLSIARFTQERGAASSFQKVIETLETVLKCRGMLVGDERKKRRMVKTLNSAWKPLGLALKMCASVKVGSSGRFRHTQNHSSGPIASRWLAFIDLVLDIRDLPSTTHLLTWLPRGRDWICLLYRAPG